MNSSEDERGKALSGMDDDGTAQRAAAIVVVRTGAVTTMVNMKLAPINTVCLTWPAFGKTIDEIAFLERVADAEIDTHIAKALRLSALTRRSMH